MAEPQLAAVRVRGDVHLVSTARDTLEMLRLYHRNYCVVVANNPINLGMLKKVKDHITWGEINEDTLKMLVEKRAEEHKGAETDSHKKIKYNDFIVVNNKKIKKFFRLNSPKKGYGRKGIKKSFENGGALGYRGDKINDLIMRMV